MRPFTSPCQGQRGWNTQWEEVLIKCITKSEGEEDGSKTTKAFVESSSVPSGEKIRKNKEEKLSDILKLHLRLGFKVVLLTSERLCGSSWVRDEWKYFHYMWNISIKDSNFYCRRALPRRQGRQAYYGHLYWPPCNNFILPFNYFPFLDKGN